MLLAGAVTLLWAASAHAADVKVTKIHNCCGACAKGITTALSGAGATNIVPKSTEVTFSAPDPDKAVKALFDAGYSGTVEGARTPGDGLEKAAPAKTLKLGGVHNCCGSCTTGIKEAMKSFGTVTIKPKETTFTVTSDKDLDPKAVVKALRDAGYNAHLEK
jgi:copper chaperone CopZ